MSATDHAPSLAVIAVTHDSARVLPGLLESLEAVTDRDRLEVCIVDSGSTPEQLDLIRQQAVGRADQVVSLPNVGFGGACNAGAAATEAPALLFTNPDVRFRSLPSRALDGRGFQGAVVGGFAVSPSRGLGFAELPGPRSEAEELALARWSRAFERAASGPAWVSGAALAIERGDFDRIGGFSPAFFMYFEDADLCLRHRLAGGRIELDPELEIEHGGGESTERIEGSGARLALDGINRLSARRFARRYGRPWDPALLYLLLVVAYAPRRVAVHLLREGWAPREAFEYLACLLRPRRALRRLEAAAAE